MIGRIIPSSFVPAGEKANRIRRRWEMLMSGEVCAGINAPPSGRGNDTARWKVYPVVFLHGSGGGGNIFVTDFTG